MAKQKQDSISFLPINRSLFNHFLWKEKRAFSKCEAWLDLIASSRFEQSQARELVGGKLMTWKRGQLPASVRYLANRWHWKSVHKVEDFLKLLKAEGMIKTDVVNGQTLITLINYEAHNGFGQQRGRENPPPSGITEDSRDTNGDSEGTARGQRGDETNKENKVNNEEQESGASAPTPKSFKKFSEEDFKEEIRKANVDLKLTDAMLHKFFGYWSERSASGLMKFQLEKTWETRRRLETWRDNQAKFDRNGNKPNGTTQTTSTGRTLVRDTL